VGTIGLDIAKRFVDAVVTVSDDDIVRARHALWDVCRVAAEPGAAATLAALQTGAYRPGPEERVALVLCGGNADPADLSEGEG
jgi:threonine dehydratase